MLDGGKDAGGGDTGPPVGADVDFEVVVGVFRAKADLGLAIQRVGSATNDSAAAGGMEQVALNRGVNELGGGDALSGEKREIGDSRFFTWRRSEVEC